MTGLRPPETVMRLERLGASHQTRLSFMRVLLRKLRREGWRFDRPVWKVDGQGVGHAVYRATGPRRTYSLVAFAHDLPDEMRSDRVIAERWDATFTLFDGMPEASDIARLADQVPLQEAGRVSDRELVLSRANRSVRLWDHVLECLSRGEQPDAARVEEVGYLMRTTAVYGSGKFGAADHAALRDREVMSGPFRAEMLTVWLIRAFVLDLIEHMARTRGGSRAAVLDPAIRRRFGIGNSTGLGMAPFLVNHPALLNAWINARETAFARVRALPSATEEEKNIFHDMLARARAQAKTGTVGADLDRLAAHAAIGWARTRPWNELARWGADNLSMEGQELLMSLMLEPYGDLVDDLADAMSTDEEASFAIDGSWPLDRLRRTLRDTHGWAMRTDFADPTETARFWYVSAAKAEPRLGDRYDEPGAELESPLDVARAAITLARDLEREEAEDAADYLTNHPEHRRIVRRVQLALAAPYAEIRDNLLSAHIRPIDMFRSKLAFFGATRFDPRSDRWIQITMYQNAPFPHELADMPEDDWIYPALDRLPETVT